MKVNILPVFMLIKPFGKLPTYMNKQNFFCQCLLCLWAKGWKKLVSHKALFTVVTGNGNLFVNAARLIIKWAKISHSPVSS